MTCDNFIAQLHIHRTGRPNRLVMSNRHSVVSRAAAKETAIKQGRALSRRPPDLNGQTSRAAMASARLRRAQRSSRTPLHCLSAQQALGSTCRDFGQHHRLHEAAAGRRCGMRHQFHLEELEYGIRHVFRRYVVPKKTKVQRVPQRCRSR